MVRTSRTARPWLVLHATGIRPCSEPARSPTPRCRLSALSTTTPHRLLDAAAVDYERSDSTGGLTLDLLGGVGGLRVGRVGRRSSRLSCSRHERLWRGDHRLAWRGARSWAELSSWDWLGRAVLRVRRPTEATASGRPFALDSDRAPKEKICATHAERPPLRSEQPAQRSIALKKDQS